MLRGICPQARESWVEQGVFEMREDGEVVWFDDGRGYGIIRRDGSTGIFVHYSAIEGKGFRTLQGGECVSFEVVQCADKRNGERRMEVEPIDNALS